MKNLLDCIDNKIPSSLKSLFDFAANCITVLVPVGGLIGLAYGWFTGKLTAVDTWKNYLIFVLAVIIIVLVYKFLKDKREHKKQIETLKTLKDEELKSVYLHLQNERSISCQRYYQLLHDYRNTINDLEHIYKNKKMTDEVLTQMVTKFLEDALNYLVETLSEMTGQMLNGCVKAIIGGNCNRISYNNAKVRTFVRSKNTSPERRNIDQIDEDGVFIRDNTDFMDIITESRDQRNSVFYQPNLKKYAEQLRKVGKEYKNTTPHWEDYYIGTIVAPIRIASKRLFYINESSGKRNRGKKNKTTYYTLGFLCVDSLSEDAFTWEQKKNYSYIVKAYAATMFNILSKNQFYLMKLHQSAEDVRQNKNRES